MSLRRLAYSIALFIAVPFAWAHLVWRARRQPEYLQHVAERFGRYPAPAPRDAIWIHAVSVGETRAAEPLVAALSDAHPGVPILFTHTTPTGRATGTAVFGDRVSRVYLPWDLPFAVAGFLRTFRPRIGIVMETELWPNLIAGCAARGVPLYLVNARLSERSARGYARVAGLTHEALSNLAGIGAQTEDDASRLRALGAPAVTVTGSLKFEIEPPAEQIARGLEWRARIGAARPVWLAASTREGEEALILDALPSIPNALLILVPRHPQRFDEVARLLEVRGLRFRRRSETVDLPPDVQVLLGDSMGEMFAYYAAGDVAFVGGSLLPLGGQNLIEPCAVGKPVLVGPHTFNFADATRGAIAAGAARRVEDGAALRHALEQLFADPEARLQMGRAAAGFAAAHRGATARTLAIIEAGMSRTR
ncbi:MAG: lipid IV(A) 3-deoxy-D-manno-octulosonic acid transferase [Burkholderiales bacterium]|nr:lipid IV(A) 3-deoxy-D-manno-octulosonic acid transferase [Burkholderiales bacterium]